MKKLAAFTIIYLMTNLQAFATESRGQINIELGRSKSSDNNFSLPNSSENEINLPDDQSFNSYRIKGRLNLKNNTFLSFLYAPFSTDYNFKSDKAFEFDNTNFNSGEDTKVDYKFNSYRIGYFKELSFKDNLKYWIGGVLKVRDAKIKVSQNGLSDSYSNIGVVPLLGIGGEYFLKNDISLFSHVDVSGFTQGYAYDFNIETRYYLNSKNALGLGYRSFGGGVDNDELMNFARFETLYVNYSFNF
ncbi:MAG: hypothetical protein ACJA0S_001415 [Rickettsiales bacterium]|jgi:hypothetical protein